MELHSKTESVIELSGVSKSYGSVVALDGVTTRIPPGVTGLLGPNGAGKTTLIKILLGVIRVSQGEITVLGERLRRGATRFRKNLGYVPEDDCYLSGLSGVETVFFSARMAGLPATEGLRRSHEILDFCGVQQERYRAVETYSTGMRQKVKFASAIVHDPRLLILDEPTSGLDPEEREAMLHRITLLARENGKSILISTHILPDVQAVCDRVVVLGRGRIVGEGELAALLTPVTDSWQIELDGTTDPSPFTRELESAGRQVSLDHESHVIVERDGVESAELFQLAERLGLTIRALRPARRSLEQYFLRAVEAHADGDS